jgi:hypothetical protein
VLEHLGAMLSLVEGRAAEWAGGATAIPEDVEIPRLHLLGQAG